MGVTPRSLQRVSLRGGAVLVSGAGFIERSYDLGGAGGSTHVPAPESAPSCPSPRTPLGSRNLNRAAWTWPDASTAGVRPVAGWVLFSLSPQWWDLGGWASWEVFHCFHEGDKKGCPYPRVEAREGPMDSRHVGTGWALDWRGFEGARRWAFELFSASFPVGGSDQL